MSLLYTTASHFIRANEMQPQVFGCEVESADTKRRSLLFRLPVLVPKRAFDVEYALAFVFGLESAWNPLTKFSFILTKQLVVN